MTIFTWKPFWRSNHTILQTQIPTNFHLKTLQADSIIPIALVQSSPPQLIERFLHKSDDDGSTCSNLKHAFNNPELFTGCVIISPIQLIQFISLMMRVMETRKPFSIFNIGRSAFTHLARLLPDSRRIISEQFGFLLPAKVTHLMRYPVVPTLLVIIRLSRLKRCPVQRRLTNGGALSRTVCSIVPRIGLFRHNGQLERLEELWENGPGCAESDRMPEWTGVFAGRY